MKGWDMAKKETIVIVGGKHYDNEALDKEVAAKILDLFGDRVVHKGPSDREAHMEITIRCD